MYCIIEVPALLGSSIAENFLEKISSLFRNETYRMVFFRSGRLRSLSQEPSWFGTYLAFATPWFLSLLLNTGKKIILPVLFFLYLVLLIFYSQSRVAWFIFIIEFVLFFILAMFFGDKKRKKSPFLYILVALLPLVVLGILYKDFFLYKFNYVFKSFGQNASLEALNSNMERIGFQYAAVCMGLDKPIFGVGLGQYGFWWKDFLPNWAIVLIPELLQDAHGTRWPTSHGLIARLFAETGLGVFIFIGVLLASLCRSMQYVRLVSKYAPSQTPLAISLTTCICGVSASLATGDSLRYFYLWLILALAWSLPIERYKKTLVSS
jgi:O-antigen ligase